MLIATLMTAAAFLGGLLGGLVNRRPRRRTKPVSAERFVIDPLVAAEMDQAAAAWSQAQGRPETKDLLADKLRLAYVIRRQPRRMKRRGRWGR